MSAKKEDLLGEASLNKFLQGQKSSLMDLLIERKVSIYARPRSTQSLRRELLCFPQRSHTALVGFKIVSSKMFHAHSLVLLNFCVRLIYSRSTYSFSFSLRPLTVVLRSSIPTSNPAFVGLFFYSLVSYLHAFIKHKGLKASVECMRSGNLRRNDRSRVTLTQ